MSKATETAGQEQQQQQLDECTLPAAVTGAFVRPAPSSHSSSQVWGMCGAIDDSQQPADTADPEMSPNPEGSEHQELSASKPSLPVAHLKVACGDMIGTLLVHKGKIVIYEGTSDEKQVSPTEFERLGGRSATKKWKQSIRLVNEDGEQGRPVGEWYVMQGLEQPKKPREGKDPHLSHSGGPASPTVSHHDIRHTATSSAIDAAAPHKRPVRSTRGHVPAKHVTAVEVATAAAAPTGRGSGRRGHNTRSTAAATKGHLLEDAGSGTTDSPDVAAALAAPAAASQDVSWLPEEQPQQPMMLQQPVMCPELPMYYNQQQQSTKARDNNLGRTAAADPAAVAAMSFAVDESADINMDYLALGDWQLPEGPGASDAGSSDLLVQVPASAPLPGDATQAVVEMTAYLEGRRSIPPWRLLPPAQRPLVGRLLVPLRQLFVMVFQAGGYVRIKDDLLTWQDMATQLGLPAWPCPDVPDPLRVLQQVYRDYLLRFEGRFSLKSQPRTTQVTPAPAAAGGIGGSVGGGVVQPALAFSAAAQCVSQAPVQLPTLSPAAAGYASAGTVADSNNLNMGVALVSSAMQQQQQSQQVQPQFNNFLPAAVAAEMLLDDGLSGDLLDLLTDLIPESDAAEPDNAAEQPQQQVYGITQPVAPASSNASDSLACTAHATNAARQHPEMAQVQQRQRLQQLQQQLQQIQQQASDGTGLQRPQLGTAGTTAGTTDSSDSVAAAVAGECGRSKRPAPLIRCGDSDLVSLMDQAEVTKLLQEYEVQQQRRQLTAVRRPVLQPPPNMPSQQQQQVTKNPSSSQLAAAIVGAVDRNMSQDLHAIMQQFYAQQQQQAQQLHQQGEQGDDLQQPADEEMSGMLEALQLAGEAAQQQQGGQVSHGRPAAMAAGVPATVHASEQLVVGPDGNSWPGKLLGQASVGAHLMRELVGGSCGSQNPQAAVGSRLLGSVTAEGTPHAVSGSDGPGLPPRPGSSTTMAPPASRQAAADQPSTQQQQLGGDDLLLPGFRDSLLRLTTPTGALLGSVLDSPTLRSNPSGQGWMDLSGLLSGDFKSMTAELTNSDGQQQAGEQGHDDPSAVLRMW